MREQVPEPRWALVVLAVTVELAGQVLRLHELHDTERPAPEPPSNPMHAIGYGRGDDR
jgi:hypothetical protein